MGFKRKSACQNINPILMLMILSIVCGVFVFGPCFSAISSFAIISLREREQFALL